jgi:hypothetical protein
LVSVLKTGKTYFTTMTRRLASCFENKIRENKNKEKQENWKQLQPIFGNRFDIFFLGIIVILIFGVGLK